MGLVPLDAKAKTALGKAAQRIKDLQAKLDALLPALQNVKAKASAATPDKFDPASIGSWNDAKAKIVGDVKQLESAVQHTKQQLIQAAAVYRV